MEDFSVITMLTKTDKKLYLEMINGKSVWTFKKNDACYFDTEKEAVKFAKKWFKHFKGWSVESVTINTNYL